MNTYPESAKYPTSAEPNADEGLGFDFMAYYHLLREKAWIIVTCALAAVALGGVYIIRTPKVYASTAEVQVNQEQNKVVNIQNVTSEDLSSLELLKTIEQNLSSRALMERVVDKLDLNAQKLNLAPDPAVPYTKAYLGEQLQKVVLVKLIRGTRLIDVTAESTDPAMAQFIANAIVSEYIRPSRWTARRISPPRS